MTDQEVDVHAKQELTQAVKVVTQSIHRNPLRKRKIMAREMKISPRTMFSIIKEYLGLGAYRKSTGQRLTEIYIKLK